MVAIKPHQKVKKEKLITGKIKQKKVTSIPKVLIQDEKPQTVALNKTKRKYKMPSKSISENSVTSCLNALEKLQTEGNKKNIIFGDETQIFMEIRCIKLLNAKGNIKFVLPHSTAASSGEVCLITPDLKKGKRPDHEPTVEHWEQLLREAGVTAVKTVLPMRQLRVEYDQFELKRRLLTQHDFIMVDTRVLNHVSHLLGKMFFKKHNMLIPVKIDEKKDLKSNIDKGLRTVMLRLSEGQSMTVLVGHTAMPQSHVKENIMALVQSLKEKFPGGEANIRAISIKFPLSLALPLYLTLRPTNVVKATKIKQIKPKNFMDCEGELTTVFNGTVRVTPEGTVQVKRQSPEEEDSVESDSEEEKDEDEGMVDEDSVESDSEEEKDEDEGMVDEDE